MNEDEYDEIRRVTVAVPAHPVVAEDKLPVVRRVLLVVGIVAIVAILAWAWWSREDTGLKSAPPSLIGTWTSSHPEYSDRPLRITSDSITFGTGGTSQVRYSIFGVAVEEVDEAEDEDEFATEYFAVHFRGDDGAEFRREIVLSESAQRLHFRSQPHVVWTRLDR
jgi:hypothetical protein